jgi:E3 ubiquitin-protein ligase UHRF1
MAKVMSGALIPMAPAQAKMLATPKAKTPGRPKRKAAPVEPTRRSTRTSKKVIQHQELPYDSEFDSDLPRKKKKTGIRTSKPELEDPDSEEKEKPPKAPRVNGKVFGPIEGVEVGKWWEYRDECGAAGVHPPTVAGIYGSAAEGGAYSVAVSAGYPEDLDLGDTFTYTGSGGRELKKKNLRTAPQSSDQTLVRGNAALDMSAQTGNPVRVIRGYKAALGPVTGYRYDGLYKVVRSYTALNAEGKYKVYKFDFERLPGQPPVDYSHKERILEAGKCFFSTVGQNMMS